MSKRHNCKMYFKLKYLLILKQKNGELYCQGLFCGVSIRISEYENRPTIFLVKTYGDSKFFKSLYSELKMPSFSSENVPDIDEIIQNGGKAKNTLLRENQALNAFKNFITEVEKKVFFFCFLLNDPYRFVHSNL